MMKRNSPLVLLIGITCPFNVMASDFVVLQVGLGGFVLTGLIIFFGFKAGTSKAKDRFMLYIFLVLILTFIGIGMVMEESDHMGDYDLWGMLGIIATSGLLALIIPLIIFIRGHDEAEKKST